MISSIFGKTKPISSIIVLSFLFVSYWGIYFHLFQHTFSVEVVLFQSLALCFLLLTILVVNFIINKNKITGTNSYTILFYTLLIITFPEAVIDNNAIFCNIFLLLALRRLVSMKSLNQTKHKIFDASLWIGVASLFYDWAILFLLLVLISIYLYDPKNLKNWLVPLVSLFTLFMIVFCVLTLLDNSTFLEKHYAFLWKFDGSFIKNWPSNSKLILYVGLTILTAVLSFIKHKKAGLGRILLLRVLMVCFIVGFMVLTLKSSSGISLVLITFFPAAVFMANYIETIKRPNIKEVVLISSVVVSFGLLAFRFILH